MIVTLVVRLLNCSKSCSAGHCVAVQETIFLSAVFIHLVPPVHHQKSAPLPLTTNDVDWCNRSIMIELTGQLGTLYNST